MEHLSAALKACHQVVGMYMNRPSPPGPTLFQVGDDILVHAAPHEIHNKHTPKWNGPFKVTKVPNRYQVEYESHGATRVTHVNRAKKYISSGYTGWVSHERPGNDFREIPTEYQEPRSDSLFYYPRPGPRGREPDPPCSQVEPAEGRSGTEADATTPPTAGLGDGGGGTDPLLPQASASPDEAQDRDVKEPSPPTGSSSDEITSENEEEGPADLSLPATNAGSPGDGNTDAGQSSVPATPPRETRTPDSDVSRDPPSSPGLDPSDATTSETTWTAGSTTVTASEGGTDDPTPSPPSTPDTAPSASPSRSSGAGDDLPPVSTTRTGREVRPPIRFGEWATVIQEMIPDNNNVKTLQAWLHGRWVNLGKDRHRKKEMLRQYLTHTSVIYYRLTLGTPGIVTLGNWAERIAPFDQWKLSPTGAEWIVAAGGWGQPSEIGGGNVGPMWRGSRRPTPAQDSHATPGHPASAPPRRGDAHARLPHTPAATFAVAERAWGRRSEPSEVIPGPTAPGTTPPSNRRTRPGPAAPCRRGPGPTAPYRRDPGPTAPWTKRPGPPAPCRRASGPPDPSLSIPGPPAPCRREPGPTDPSLRPTVQRNRPPVCNARPPICTGTAAPSGGSRPPQDYRLWLKEKIAALRSCPASPYVPEGGVPSVVYLPGGGYSLHQVEFAEGREPQLPRPPRQDWSPSAAPVDPRVTAPVTPPSPVLPPHLRRLFSPVFSPEHPQPEIPDRGLDSGHSVIRQLKF